MHRRGRDAHHHDHQAGSGAADQPTPGGDNHRTARRGGADTERAQPPCLLFSIGVESWSRRLELGGRACCLPGYWLALLTVILDLGPDPVARCLKVDIYPTLVALHGDTPDVELQGRSFIPLLTASGATDPQAPTMIWFSGAFWNSVLCVMMLLNAVFLDEL